MLTKIPMLRFTKMNGAGNDFVLIDNRLGDLRLAPEQISKICDAAAGFIYYVSREGVTGAQKAVAASVRERIAELREQTELPVAVGFGISTPEHARQVAQFADAVVVGSAIVDTIAKLRHDTTLAAGVTEFVRPLVEAVKQ